MNVIKIKGEDFVLRASRSVYWPRKKTLLVADLHWGKPETFQKYGIPVASDVLREDLERLTDELHKTAAARLFILGDMIHSRAGITQDVDYTIQRWRSQHSELEIVLLRGNHDRNFTPPQNWKIQVHDGVWREDGFAFSHEMPGSLEEFLWLGHEHPVIRLRGRGDSLRLPCFVVDPHQACLPAFSAFTGGVNVSLKTNRRVYAIADSEVIDIN